MNALATPHQFSFEELATEVTSVVEDLRWLHLELTLRNRFNEVLFTDVDSIESFVRLAFENVRTRVGALEFAVYERQRSGVNLIFRDCDSEAFWQEGFVPWYDEVLRLFRTKRLDDELQRARVFHYTAERHPLSAIIMPVSLDAEVVIVLLFVVRTNALIPRFRHFASSLAIPVSVSIDSIRNVQKLRARSRELETRVGERTAELEWTHNFLVKLVDSTDVMMMACDRVGNVIIWNRAAEETTGIERQRMRTVQDFFDALHLSDNENSDLYQSLRTEFVSRVSLPNFEISMTTRTGEQRVISWTNTVLRTDRGNILLEVGLDITEQSKLLERIIAFELQMESVIRQREHERDHDASQHRSVLERAQLLILELEPNGRIVYCNKHMQSFTGYALSDVHGHSALDSFIAPQDREQFDIFLDALSEDFGEPFQLAFPVKKHSGERVLVHWQAIAPRATSENQRYIAFGLADEATQLDAGAFSPHVHYMSGELEAKLAQRYRFLMKYVPFPLVHIDDNDCIVNANPAFQELVDVPIAYGTPLRDVARCEIHDTRSDPTPCTLYVVQQTGISMSYRGFITTLSIFQKRVREITISMATDAR